MAIDSFIIKGLQGDERDLEERLIAFLNTNPPKKIVSMTSWVVGIEVYIMILYQVGKPVENRMGGTFKQADDIQTYMGRGKGDY